MTSAFDRQRRASQVANQVYGQEEAIIVALIRSAQQSPDRKQRFLDQHGNVIAVLEVLAEPERPRKLPRALRPKQRLSKRQRDVAKREKLHAHVA